MKPSVYLALALILSACGTRGTFETPINAEDTRTMFLVTNREANPPYEFGDVSSPVITRMKYEVAIPENRAPGDLAFNPENSKAFGVTDALEFKNSKDFADALAESDPENSPIGVFVHGYNNNVPEALYRHTQMARDFERHGPQVTFAWPSRAQANLYVADRDAANISRDALAKLLTDLNQLQNRPIILMGHSMGAYIVMESLRQLALAGDDVMANLEAVMLISPDLDIDLFRSQASAIPNLPNPFIVVISDRDKALRASARIAGKRPRLGSPDDLERLRDLDIIAVDISEFRGGEASGHFSAATSPHAIAYLKGLASTGALYQEMRAGLEILAPDTSE